MLFSSLSWASGPSHGLRQEARGCLCQRGLGTVPAPCSGTPQLTLSPTPFPHQRGNAGLPKHPVTVPLGPARLLTRPTRQGQAGSRGQGPEASNKNISRTNLCRGIPPIPFNPCRYNLLCGSSLPHPPSCLFPRGPPSSRISLLSPPLQCRRMTRAQRKRAGFSCGSMRSAEEQREGMWLTLLLSSSGGKTQGSRGKDLQSQGTSPHLSF